MPTKKEIEAQEEKDTTKKNDSGEVVDHQHEERMQRGEQVVEPGEGEDEGKDEGGEASE